MELGGVAVIAGGVLLFGLVSGRLKDSVLTPPLAFIIFGVVIGSAGLGLAKLDTGHGALHALAEVTLVLVLFSDAARIELKRLRGDHDLPVRLLLVGLPLTILLGAAVAALLFPWFSIWEAALLAAILAPTDAALGQAVVSNPLVPARVRQALNIESGLNDGIVLPVVLLLASVASAMSGEGQGVAHWVQFAALQVTVGPIAGGVVGYVGARLIDRAALREWMTPSFQGLGALALAVLAYAVAEVSHGNGFIAAFVAGSVFGNAVRHRCAFLFEFAEAEGQLLTLFTFLVFGAVMVPLAWGHVDARVALYVACSLTVVRMVPSSIALVRSKLSLPSHLFVGWFGPRGLASILFALLILEEAVLPHREELLIVTIVTVAASALLHGMSAAPLARRYGAFVKARGECAEKKPVSELPTREGVVGS